MRSHSKALFAVAALFALCALVPIAQGAPGEAITSFGETGTEGGQLSSPAGVAVSQASGDVYVANTGNNRIEQFTQDGTFIRAWGKDVVKDGGPGDIPPIPIVVNERQDIEIRGPLNFGCFCPDPITGGTFTLSFNGQTTGPIPYDATAAQVQSALEALSNIDTVTVTGGPGPGEGFGVDWTVEFTGSLAGTDVAEMNADASGLEPTGSVVLITTVENGSTTLDYGLEVCTDPATCQPGTVGDQDGELQLSPDATPQLAIDQADGSVYVADSDNNRIQKFSATGAFIDEFGIKGTGPGELDRPRGVAVDPTSGDIYVADTNNNRVQRFDSSGNFKAEIGNVGPGVCAGCPTRVAVDSTGRLYVLVLAAANGTSDRVQRFDSSGAFEEIFGAGQIKSPTELAVDPATDHAYVAATFEGVTGIHEFDESGEWLETYGASANITPGGLALPSASNRIYVSDTPKDRVVRIIFSTDPVPPSVEALPAAVVTDSSAWLGAELNPLKSATSFWVEYSTDEGFANSTSVPAGKNASAGEGNKVVLANQLVKGLQPETTYYFRVVATSVGGTTEGDIGSFTTLADTPQASGLPDGRIWEKVSPAYKAGSHISVANNRNVGIFALRSQAASDGDSVAFASEGKFGGEGAPANSQYLARRGPDGGWVTEGINPPVTPVGGIQHINFYAWFGEDLGWGVVKTNTALHPGDPEKIGNFNLYLRDNETKTYDLISDVGDRTVNFRGASADGSTVVFRAEGGVQSEKGKLFQWTSSGGVERIGILPGGSEGEADIGNAMSTLSLSAGFNPVSADGSRVYFTPILGPEGAAFSGDAPLYVREGGETIPVSVSERAGDDPSVPRKGRFLGASKDGSIVFFFSNQRLTDKSNANIDPVSGDQRCDLPLHIDGTDIRKFCVHLYRRDADAPEGQRLTDLTTADPQGSQVLGMTGMSDDGTSVYFVANGDLSGSGERDGKLYLWREGEGVRLVADAEDAGLWDVDILRLFRRARVTPDGRFLAFESHTRLTSYDTDGTTQVYLYDSATETLTCASCGTVSARSKADSWLLSSYGQTEAKSDGNEKLTTNLSPDGRLVFDSADALVPEDTNGAVDVYELQEGRLHLLSSGTSATASRLLDSSTDLDDVFFVTEQQLVRSDNDTLRDLYDARVGGLAEPDVTPPCVADECQGTPSPPPASETPSSMSFRGAGNASSKKRRCAKSKVRRKGRCLKRKARKAKRHKQGRKTRKAKSNERTG